MTHATRIARPLIVALCLALGWASAAVAADLPKSVTVSAGNQDRRYHIATFALDPKFASSRLWLREGRGNPNAIIEFGGTSHRLQVGPDGRAIFLLTELKAGQSHEYHIEEEVGSKEGAPPLAAVRVDGRIDIRSGLDTVLMYRGEKTPLPAGFEPQYARGGYLHPLVTPAGVTVTDDYPSNHKHHHGVWSPWTKTEFEGRKPDFWNMGAKTGTVEFVGFGQMWSGPFAAGFTAKHRFVDLSAKPDPKPALNETWRVDAYSFSPGRYRLIDWESTQTTASDSPLKLPKYHYGGLGVRGHRQWDGENNSQYLTSEGKTRKDGNDTRAKWVVNYGKVDGKPVYVAVLCSPENFRFPQPVRLHPKEPFLCYAPQMLGDMAIEPGKPYVSKYRFVVGDGEPDNAELDRLWADYAEPVTVEAK